MADINGCTLVAGKWICHSEPVLLRGRGVDGARVQRMGQADGQNSTLLQGAPELR